MSDIVLIPYILVIHVNKGLSCQMPPVCGDGRKKLTWMSRMDSTLSGKSRIRCGKTRL